MDVATQGTAIAAPHTGTFIATGLTIVNSSPVITMGDVFICTQHGTQAVASGSSIVKDLNGQPMALIGSLTTCGEAITVGEPKLQIPE